MWLNKENTAELQQYEKLYQLQYKMFLNDLKICSKMADQYFHRNEANQGIEAITREVVDFAHQHDLGVERSYNSIPSITASNYIVPQDGALRKVDLSKHIQVLAFPEGEYHVSVRAWIDDPDSGKKLSKTELFGEVKADGLTSRLTEAYIVLNDWDQTNLEEEL